MERVAAGDRRRSGIHIGPLRRHALGYALLLAVPACQDSDTRGQCGWTGAGEVFASSCPPPTYERLIAGAVTDMSGRPVLGTRVNVISKSLRPEGCVWHGPVRALVTSAAGGYAERLSSARPVGCVMVRVRPAEELGLVEVVLDTTGVTYYDSRDPTLAADTLILNITLPSAASGVGAVFQQRQEEPKASEAQDDPDEGRVASPARPVPGQRSTQQRPHDAGAERDAVPSRPILRLEPVRPSAHSVTPSVGSGG